MGQAIQRTETFFDGFKEQKRTMFSKVLEAGDMGTGLQIIAGHAISGCIIQCFDPVGKIKQMSGEDKANISGTGKFSKLNFNMNGQSGDFAEGDKLTVLLWS